VLVNPEPPNFRSDAREKLARLSRVQFLELATDVHDEVIRINNNKTGDAEAPFLPARDDHHPRRNEARQKIANIRPALLKDLMSDIFYELGRRYPKFKELKAPSEPLGSTLSISNLPVPQVVRGNARTPQNTIDQNFSIGGEGEIVRIMARKLGYKSIDVISSRMVSHGSVGDSITRCLCPPKSIAEVIDILKQHGCPDVTNTLDLSRCSAAPVAGGGFGDVYQGYLKNGVEVAIKCARVFLETDLNHTTFKVRYMINCGNSTNTSSQSAACELYAWSKYNHRNVVELLGLAQFRDRIAMISPWMRNGTLGQYLTRFPDADRCRIVGVSFFHAKPC
jgi:hypothetical protein